MNRELCRSNRSRQHGRWWYLELTRWIHGTIRWLHQFSMSSWYSQPSRCIDDQQYLYRHQHPNEYGRNPMGRRSKVMWHQQHHRIPSFRRSSARIVSSGQHRPRRFVCRHPWRRSWGLELGNIWWRWRDYRARRHRSLVPLEYGRSNRWYLQTTKVEVKISISLK